MRPGFAACAVALLMVAGAAAGAPTAADFVLVEKAQHRMTLFANHRVLRTYRVALGSGGLAAKAREGDRRTPEGRYRIDGRLKQSAFHLALHISYPSAADRRAAAMRHVRPGGAIMIHGLPNGMGWLGAKHRLFDWTYGCIAVTDEEIEEIWRLVPNGTAVEIRK